MEPVGARHPTQVDMYVDIVGRLGLFPLLACCRRLTFPRSTYLRLIQRLSLPVCSRKILFQLRLQPHDFRRYRQLQGIQCL